MVLGRGPAGKIVADTVIKLLIYRHARRRYTLPPWQKYLLSQLVYVGDEFQNAITASHDGTGDFNVIDRLRDCLLMLVVSAQAFESLIPPQTKEQAEVFALNLKNLVMYRAASEADALRCAGALGKHWVERATRTVHVDHTSHTQAQQINYGVRQRHGPGFRQRKQEGARGPRLRNGGE